MSLAIPISGARTTIRIVVVGDRGTGKSSLIAAASGETLPPELPNVLPPTCLPADFYPDNVPITIIDTSSNLEDGWQLVEELKRADSVVLAYACDQPWTLARLTSFWLPELRRLEIKAPVVVASCKVDQYFDEEFDIEVETQYLLQQFMEIHAVVHCSVDNTNQVQEVFYYAQKTVLYPRAPLIDRDSQCLSHRCQSALEKIFSLCDHDMDGALNDEELNKYQIKCFNRPLQPAEIRGVKNAVRAMFPEGVNELGLTLDGFVSLHSLFISIDLEETTWSVLRKFGYDDELNLRDDHDLLVPNEKAPEQAIYYRVCVYMLQCQKWMMTKCITAIAASVKKIVR